MFRGRSIDASIKNIPDKRSMCETCGVLAIHPYSRQTLDASLSILYATCVSDRMLETLAHSVVNQSVTDARIISNQVHERTNITTSKRNSESPRGNGGQRSRQHVTQISVYNAGQENVKRKPGDQRAAIIRTRRPLTGDTRIAIII